MFQFRTIADLPFVAFSPLTEGDPRVTLTEERTETNPDAGGFFRSRSSVSVEVTASVVLDSETVEAFETHTPARHGLPWRGWSASRHETPGRVWAVASERSEDFRYGSVRSDDIARRAAKQARVLATIDTPETVARLRSEAFAALNDRLARLAESINDASTQSLAYRARQRSGTFDETPEFTEARACVAAARATLDAARERFETATARLDAERVRQWRGAVETWNVPDATREAIEAELSRAPTHGLGRRVV